MSRGARGRARAGWSSPTKRIRSWTSGVGGSLCTNSSTEFRHEGSPRTNPSAHLRHAGSPCTNSFTEFRHGRNLRTNPSVDFRRAGSRRTDQIGRFWAWRGCVYEFIRTFPQCRGCVNGIRTDARGAPHPPRQVPIRRGREGPRHPRHPGRTPVPPRATGPDAAALAGASSEHERWPRAVAARSVPLEVDARPPDRQPVDPRDREAEVGAIPHAKATWIRPWNPDRSQKPSVHVVHFV